MLFLKLLLLAICAFFVWYFALRQLPPIRARRMKRFNAEILRLRKLLKEDQERISSSQPGGAKQALDCLSSMSCDLERAEKYLYRRELDRVSSELMDARGNHRKSRKCLKTAKELAKA